jgi:hypothetical protein
MGGRILSSVGSSRIHWITISLITVLESFVCSMGLGNKCTRNISSQAIEGHMCFPT